MPMIREWKWNEHDTGSDGVTLHSDRLVRWTTDWAAPFTDAGREWAIDEFRASGSSTGIPPNVWKELQQEVEKLGKEREK